MNAPHLTTLRNADHLVAAGLLAPDERAPIDAVAERYAISIAPEVAGLISAEGRGGPVARQYLPSAD
ncbi:MAG: hypothetical protein KDE14_10270, partial [Rhodobacteraceae bacterium]|nr:hypothetical protein [Paracoccaceae bacterium]